MTEETARGISSTFTSEPGNKRRYLGDDTSVQPLLLTKAVYQSPGTYI